MNPKPHVADLIRDANHASDQTARLVRKALVLLIVALVVSSFDLVGLQDHTRAFSRDVFYRLWAIMYPRPAEPAASVVLVNDDSIAGWDVFPPKYGTHAHFMRALLARKPKALFVDFAFIDQRDDPTLGDLIDAIKDFDAAKVPVYLAVYGPDPEKGLRPELRQLASEGRAKLVSFEFGRFLLGNSVYTLRSKSQNLDTVAHQIFRDFYPAPAAQLANLSDYEIWWALPPSALNCQFRENACGNQPGSWWERIKSIAQLEFLAIKLFPSPEGVAVPYNPFLFAWETLGGIDEETVARAIAGKFIFYGSHLALAEDRHPNPVFAFGSDKREIPGVFVHAMALENLIDLKGEVKKPRPEDQFWVWMHDVFMIVLIVPLLLGLWIILRKKRPIIENLAILLFALGIAWVEFRWFNLGPSNWAGVVAFVAIARGWERPRILLEHGLLRLAGSVETPDPRLSTRENS